jgi:FkbM family methyltransferase
MIPTEPSLTLLQDVLATGILTDPFMLVDVGASGGIAPWWYTFGAHLRAVGFDPLLAEMQRQQALRPHEGITYVAGAVTYHGYDALCPPALRRAEVRGQYNAWLARSSCQRAMKRTQYNYTKERFNSGMEVVHADTLYELDTYFAPDVYGTIDFLKIDTDGHDYAVLLGAEQLLQSEVLGVLVEADFHGPVHDHANTYSSIDRFLRARGYTLFDLEAYRYSRAALPARFCHALLAQTVTGQTCWGDLLYLKDYGDPLYARKWKPTSPQKLVKLLCLFLLFGLPDCAAELLETHAHVPALATVRPALLDQLAAVAYGSPVSYRDYLAAFDADPTAWFPRPPPPTPEAQRVVVLEQTVATLEQTVAGLHRTHASTLAARAHEITVLQAAINRKVPTPRRAFMTLLRSLATWGQGRSLALLRRHQTHTWPLASLERRVVHNGALVQGEGPLEVVTPEGLWAYALELPVVSETMPQPLMLRVDMTVTQGTIGVLAIGYDEHVLSEDTCDEADGPLVLERLLPVGCRALVIRNHQPEGGASSVHLRCVRTRPATAREAATLAAH